MSAILTDFLLERIAEDEAVGGGSGRATGTIVFHIVHWDHRRTRAECAAKRRIVELMSHVLESWSANHGGPGWSMWPDVNRRERHHANEVLYSLALPYADHPDYREEWRT